MISVPCDLSSRSFSCESPTNSSLSLLRRSITTNARAGVVWLTSMARTTMFGRSWYSESGSIGTISCGVFWRSRSTHDAIIRRSGSTILGWARQRAVPGIFWKNRWLNQYGRPATWSMWACVSATVGDANVGRGHNPMSKTRSSSGTWTTACSPATETPWMRNGAE